MQRISPNQNPPATLLHRLPTKEKSNILHNLAARERGFHSAIGTSALFTTPVNKRINKELNHVMDDVTALSNAIKTGKLDKIEFVVGDLLNHVLESTSLHVSGLSNPLQKHQHREQLIALGGIDLLLQLFLPPFAPVDARQFTKAQLQERAEMWNEVLVIIRETINVVPSITEEYFDDRHMVFLFTLLSHPPVFDNTMSVLEEILACRSDTLDLSKIPNFNNLVKTFSPRHLSHFCRVLSLLVFEPEDRQIMEGAHTLCSFELLQLRRNRVSRNNTGMVEKNQNLVIEMSVLLSRLIQILRIINFGPTLTDLVNNNIITHMPITSEVLEFYSNKYGINDWDHFTNLETVVERYEHARNSNPNYVSTSRDDEADSHVDVLRAFSPQASTGDRALEYSNIANVMTYAHGLGIAQYTPLGNAVMLAARTSSVDELSRLLNGMQRGPVPSRAEFRVERLDAIKAKKELQFHAMILTPHQIELVFVLCTLLSGRRKLAVQKKLIDLQFGDVLMNMFNRMSWNAPPYAGPNHMEHIHGPNCECNPESAVRIQFLRMVHNFYDRDFLGNPNKYLILSPEEKKFILQPNANGGVDDAEDIFALDLAVQSGLMGKIITTLHSQSMDSNYRFWLSACIENFLRGCGRRGQWLVYHANILVPTIQHVISISTPNVEDPSDEATSSNTSSLQTSFDLLGEVVKGNAEMLQRLEASLTTEMFQDLITVVMDHLVESNVFLRSLYLTMEIISAGVESGKKQEEEACSPELFGFVHNAIHATDGMHLEEFVPGRRSGYLRDSWIQFYPQPMVDTAVDMYDSKSVMFDELEGKLNHNKKTATSTSEVSTPTSTLSSIIKDIRKATTHYFRFGDTSSTPPPPANAAVVKPSPTSSSMSSSSAATSPMKSDKSPWNTDNVSELMDDLSNLHLPNSEDADDELPSTNHKTANKLSLAAPLPTTPLPTNLPHNSTEEQVVSGAYVPRLPQHDDSPFYQKGCHPAASTAGNFAISNPLFRLSMFLLQEKHNMLLRLMTIVSLKNINHENICCLNTTLLILLFEYARGNLANCLAKLRSIADVEYGQGKPVGGKLYRKLRQQQQLRSQRKGCCAACKQEDNILTTPVETDSEQAMFCNVCSVASSPASASSPFVDEGTRSRNSTTGGELLMRNFRELLWYWQEYYLRRGRDRLSIEFSCHIPFRFWYELVGVLCADDGGPMSLLSEPIALPVSPYQNPLIPTLLFQRAAVNGGVLNLA